MSSSTTGPSGRGPRIVVYTIGSGAVRAMHFCCCAGLSCISHLPTVKARDTTARTSLRLPAVLDVLFKYACARLFPPPGSRLVLTVLSRTSPRHVVKNAGYRLVFERTSIDRWAQGF